MELEDAIKILKPAVEGAAFASDLVLVMTRHPEFEENARYTPIEWSPEKVVGQITFIDGNKYRMTVEVIK